MRSSVLSRSVFPALCASLLVAAFAPASAEAETYTLTTKASDGGFDGWIDRYGNKSSAGSVQLNVGNVQYGGYSRSAAVMMFGLGSLPDLTGQKVVSVTLSYYVIQAFASPVLTVTHGVKTTPEVVFGDASATLLSSVWDQNLGNVSPGPSGVGTVSFDVTEAFLADMIAGNAYSSYRLVQANTYPNPAQTPYGSYVASAENTSGYLVPTLTITTAPIIPEPAHIGALLAGAVTLGSVFIYRRRKG